MLTYEPAHPEHYEEFLALMQKEMDEYLDHVMSRMHLTLEQFAHLLRTTGKVYSIYQEGALVGYYWIEERENTLHLHGLVLKEGFRGRGIGTEVLTVLAEGYAGKMEAIELGVHESNARAKALYERLGYREVKYLPELGFSIMQRPLSQESPS